MFIYLKKFDFLEIYTKAVDGGTSMWISLKSKDQSVSNPIVRNIKMNNQKNARSIIRKIKISIKGIWGNSVKAKSAFFDIDGTIFRKSLMIEHF